MVLFCSPDHIALTLAHSFSEVFCFAVKLKFQIPDDVISFVMETDGCDIEAKDIIEGAVGSSDALMVLCRDEKWEIDRKVLVNYSYIVCT